MTIATVFSQYGRFSAVGAASENGIENYIFNGNAHGYGFGVFILLIFIMFISWPLLIYS